MTNSSLYDTDFIAWVKQQVQLLKVRSFEQLDLENLIEEVECLIHEYQNFVRHHATRLWYYLLTEKYEGFPNQAILEWHRSKAGYHHSMLESFLESPDLERYFEEEYTEIYERVAFNWCCDRGDWEKTLLPQDPPIPLNEFLRDGNLYWLLKARSQNQECEGELKQDGF